MEFSRVWCMPNADTFSMKPIKLLLDKYCLKDKVIIDPFARNSLLSTYSNDLNPDTSAQYHMDALDFVLMLKEKGVLADIVLFDPPYSPRQVSEVYQSIGKKVSQNDTQTGMLYRKVRDALDDVLKPQGIAISFGWNSNGFGITRKYSIVEIMLVAHGGAHNDTIVLVEKKNSIF